MRAPILSIGVLILAAEVMNAGVDAAIAYILEDQHPLAEKARDARSAAAAVTGIAGCAE